MEQNTLNTLVTMATQVYTLKNQMKMFLASFQATISFLLLQVMGKGLGATISFLLLQVMGKGLGTMLNPPCRYASHNVMLLHSQHFMTKRITSSSSCTSEGLHIAASSTRANGPEVLCHAGVWVRESFPVAAEFSRDCGIVKI